MSVLSGSASVLGGLRNVGGGESSLAARLRRVPPGWTVLVLADRGLWSPRLWKRIRRLGWHPLLRIQRRTTITPDGGERRAAGALVRPGEAWIGRGALGGREDRR